jgi:hypothetical protein
VTGAGGEDGWVARSAWLLENLGFTLDHEATDLPRGGADLHVGLRDRPTLRHFDPEVIAYWVDRGGRGRHAYLDRESFIPRRERFQWGDVRIADRLGETNRFLVFGGEVTAAPVNETFVAVRFRSAAPILRAGGHSQGVDALEPEVGAFFGRIMIPVDFTGGAEQMLTTIEPAGLYVAFVVDTERRLGGGRRGVDSPLLGQLRHEATRLRTDAPDAWAAATDLLRSLDLD